MSRKFRFLIIFLVITLSVFSQKHLRPEGVKVPENLKIMVRQDLIENILPFWMKYMTDSVNEGFYGRIDGNNRVYPEAVKGGILNARILWTFSSAFRVTHDKQYLRMAERAKKDYVTGHVRKQRSWWEQAETVIGYLNAFELTGNEIYLKRSTDPWEYIERNFIDSKNGGWFSYMSEEGNPSGDKGGFWICPYYNGRMCMEVIERAGD